MYLKKFRIKPQDVVSDKKNTFVKIAKNRAFLCVVFVKKGRFS